jgi:hypothetical protein
MAAHENVPNTAVAAEPPSAPVTSSSVAEPNHAPVPAAPVHATLAPRRGPNRQPGRGLAGLLAAALVVLAGVAFVSSRGDGTLGAGQATPSLAAPATAAPDAKAGTGNEKPPAEGNDRGKDKEKDKPCHGNGNGRGCGGGGDDDDD